MRCNKPSMETLDTVTEIRISEGRHFNQSQPARFKMHAHASLKYESSPWGTNVLYSVVVLTVVTYCPTDCAPRLRQLKIYQNYFTANLGF